MDLSHPFSITFCKIVIDSYNVHAFAFKCIKICRKCRYKSLSFTSTHLGNTSLVQYYTTNKLYPVMAHTKYTRSCLPDCCICFRQYVIQRFTISKPFLKSRRFCLKFFITKLLIFRSKSLYFINNWYNTFYLMLAVRSEYLTN